MRKFVKILILSVAALGVAMPVGAQLQWRETNQEIAAASLVDPRVSDGIEIFSKDGSIIVRTPHRVQVKVFTILGQLVSQATVNAGTSSLKINSRGIYIVKIGNVTQKVAL